MFRLLLFVTAIFAMYVVAADVERYSDKYDYIDIPQILADPSQREQYYSCFMETKPCASAESKFFAGIFPDALKTKCVKCTEKQKKMIDYLVMWYPANQADEWKAVLDKALKDAETKKTPETS